jgi:hypothetical protein
LKIIGKNLFLLNSIISQIISIIENSFSVKIILNKVLFFESNEELLEEYIEKE